MGRAPCGRNAKQPDTNVAATAFACATVDVLEVLLRTGAKTAAGGEHNRDEKGTALIVREDNNTGDLK